MVKKPDIPNIAEALDRYLADAQAQQLSGETIRKYENLLLRRFLPWCQSKGFRYLKQLGVEEMRQFRATWTDSAIYASKNLERLRSFFRFCMHDDWISKNPARAVKAPKVTDKPTLPLTQEEVLRIGDTIALIGSHRYLEERGQETPDIHDRLERMAADGRSVVVVGDERHVCGLIAIADAVRPEARGIVEALRRQGVAHIVMLTGDNKATAAAIAAQTGVEEVGRSCCRQTRSPQSRNSSTFTGRWPWWGMG